MTLKRLTTIPHQYAEVENSHRYSTGQKEVTVSAVRFRYSTLLVCFRCAFGALQVRSWYARVRLCGAVRFGGEVQSAYCGLCAHRA